MKIINDGLLTEFKQRIRCENCRAIYLTGLDPAHIHSRGAGQLDIRCNLVALCRRCHNASHGKSDPPRWQLIVLAARRENCQPEDIIAVVHLLRRIPKNSSQPRIIEFLAELGAEAARLARRELTEAGILEESL